MARPPKVEFEACQKPQYRENLEPSNGIRHDRTRPSTMFSRIFCQVLVFSSLAVLIEAYPRASSSSLPFDDSGIGEHCVVGVDGTCERGFLCASFGPSDKPHCVEEKQVYSR